jgi:hypothetical protein
MRLEKAGLKAIQYSCKNFHYSKSVPVNPFAFSVFNNKNEWCGCILYSLGANPSLAKPYGLVNGSAIELTRMALNGKQESTSKSLSLSLKLLNKYLPLVKLVVSFADQNQNHYGTIYQATNWYFTGIGKSTPEYFVKGKWVHQRQYGSLGYSIKNNTINKTHKTRIGLNKYRYIYTLDKSLIPLCKSLSKPYPKKEIQAIEA